MGGMRPATSNVARWPRTCNSGAARTAAVWAATAGSAASDPRSPPATPSADLDPAVLAPLLADPDEPFRRPAIVVLKDSRSSTVIEFDLPVGGVLRRVIYKRLRRHALDGPLGGAVPAAAGPAVLRHGPRPAPARLADAAAVGRMAPHAARPSPRGLPADRKGPRRRGTAPLRRRPEPPRRRGTPGRPARPDRPGRAPPRRPPRPPPFPPRPQRRQPPRQRRPLVRVVARRRRVRIAGPDGVFGASTDLVYRSCRRPAARSAVPGRGACRT